MQHNHYNVQKSRLSTKRIKHYIYYTPHSSAMKNFLSFDFRIYLATRLCRGRPVGKYSCKTSAYLFMTHDIYIVETRTNKHKHTDLLL